MGWYRWRWVRGVEALSWALAIAGCDADEDGGAESAAGSESVEDTGTDADTGDDVECVRGGLADPGADVLLPGGSIATSIGLVSPGSASDAFGASVRFGLFADDLPPREELAGFVNGCPIAEEPPESEGGGAVFYFVKNDEVPVDPVAGANLTIEVRHGDDVLMRRTAQLPAVLPELTSPAAGAAVGGAVTLAWAPLGLAALGAESTELGATGWIFDETGSAGTDGRLELVDADGTAPWAGTSEWTHVELQANVDYGNGFALGISHYQRVNGPQ